ncbi:MAG: DUF4418 family protein [Spirochaetales bacterium]|jgi:hypothetical protein|nr:DUF4418 family protein [Spirochaetales bacterium]
MKNRILSGAGVIVLGLLISLGPQFLFKVCGPVVSHDGGGSTWMKCHWSAQAEIGVGALAAALGIAILLFVSRETRIGLSVGVFFSAVLAALIPHVLIGGCSMASMPCQTLAFPAITVFSILLLVFSLGNIVYLIRRVKQ